VTRSPWRALVGVILLLTAPAGCGDSNSPPVEPPCPGDLVEVTVENPGSASPRFVWTPECPVALVQVSALEQPSGVRWSLSGRLTNVIESGIAYGEQPFGTRPDTGPLPLEPGATYEVRVLRAVEGEDGVALAGGGTAVFTH
jgi:hypothetical protein